MNRLYGRIPRDLTEKDFQGDKEDEQSGFRAGRSCSDNVFYLKKTREKDCYKPTRIIPFVDLQKAYDTRTL